MSNKQYPSNLYLESAATNLEFAKRVSAEAVAVMAKELLALRKAREGWKLVPVIPFPSQWAAGQKAFDSAGINKVDPVYKAMIAAAPEPPAC